MVSRRRITPSGEKKPAVNGLYVHSSPPRVLNVNSAHIRLLIRSGDLEKLEQLVLEGQGAKLVGEYSADYKIRTFLKSVPQYMSRINLLHDAVSSGSLNELQNILQEDCAKKKKMVMCKDSSGVGLLHKAIYYDLPDIAKYLLENFPQTAAMKDAEGRTPAHYIAMCKDPREMQRALTHAGADLHAIDGHGHSYKYYMENPGELELPNANKPVTANGVNKNFGKQESIIIKPSNIRIWIHQKDLGRLQKVLWEGQGAKLRREHSNNPKVKRFLEAVPHLMGTIKEIHSAAVNNDLELLKDRTQDPVPPIILSSRDTNGLCPIHKAVGLGHKEIAEYILEKLPESIQAADLEGRTPLHYSIPLKDDDEMYNWLLSAGAEEGAVDNRHKTAAYYRTRPNEFQASQNLQFIPEAPRTAGGYPSSWDWNLLNETIEDTKKSKKSDALFGTTPTEEKQAVEELSTDKTPDEPETEEKSEAVDETTKDEVTENDATEASDMVEEAVPVAEAEPEQEPEAEPEPKPEPDSKPEPKLQVEEQNGTTEEHNPKDDAEVIEAEAEAHPEKVEKQHEDEEPEVVKSETPESQKIGVIEGVVNGEDEVETLNNDENNEDLNGATGGGAVMDSDIIEMVESGNMEQLATLVLNGEGDRLIGQQSNNPEIQAFLENVPIYMSKINRVHIAARDGSLRDLQAALDRRKFAIAKDQISPNGATPLHVATIFGNTSIVRYLAGRFPETLQMQDDNGRTPLHYAATVADNGHYYNLLVHLGASSNIEDKDGRTAEYYLGSTQSDFSHRHLLEEFGAREDEAQGILSDKVPNDTVSARRDLDDADMLTVLDRCYRLLQGRRDSNTSQLSINAAASIPTVLGKYLRRNVFEAVKMRLTRLDHNFYDCIWPSVKKLPPELSVKYAMEDDFPYCVVAPDRYAYTVFHEFFEPFLKDIHCLNVLNELPEQPPPTYVPPGDELDELDIEFDLDTHGKWILSGNLDSCRNLRDFEFPKSLYFGQLETVERKITSALMKPKIGRILMPNLSDEEIKEIGNGTYYTMNEILEDPSEIRVTLAASGLLVPLWNIGESDRLHGKFWPYGRGVFVSNGGDVAVWINVLDHLRIVSSTNSEKPGNIGLIYAKTCKILNELEKSLAFKRDEKLGYLSARPTAIGNSLQFTLNVKFPYLKKEPGNLKHLCVVRGLSYKETHQSSDIVRIGNQQCLGVTEIQTFEDFVTAVTNILQLEKDLAMHNSMHIAQMFVNMFRRKRSSLISN